MCTYFIIQSAFNDDVSEYYRINNIFLKYCMNIPTQHITYEIVLFKTCFNYLKIYIFEKLFQVKYKYLYKKIYELTKNNRKILI